jgi:hypothetical protein
MIPSDHFVRFYNEAFKYIESCSEDALRDFWLAISRHQEITIAPLVKEHGLPGLKRYYDRIIEEENLDAECHADADHFDFRMRSCASLKKAMDNDAGVMSRYCDHCAGWINPLMTRLGYHPVFDIESRSEPHCRFSVFRNAEEAERAARNGRIVIC